MLTEKWFCGFFSSTFCRGYGLKILRLILLLILAVYCLTSASAATVRSESIRVAILKGADEFTVEGGGFLAADEHGNPIQLPAQFTLRRSSAFMLTSDGRRLKRLTVSSAGRIRVNGKGYRGLVDFYPADKGLLAVNELPLEEYLVGLINCEISSLWPAEAVKAQAVIARSYAIYQKDARRGALYHLESSVMDQVYDGADIEDNRAAKAVLETEGEVLTYADSVIQAFYHSNCGGHTESARNVWGNDLPYLQGVECGYCLSAPSARWEVSLPLKKVESQLKTAGYNLSGLISVRCGELNRSGRLKTVYLSSAKGEKVISGVDFRKAIGYSVIKSTNFTITGRGDELLFSGSGNGHGVGLCQWGGKQRAADGFSYREILSYYYAGTTIARLKNI